ncbi:MAG TPA: glycoside hydrolase family 2 protein [Armatimonadota bacterium]|nr:glycoside hydrolase family 2 protein [Armatimonadota bacterium]
MHRTELAQHWKVIDAAPDAGDPRIFSQPGLDTSAWLDIAVPGDVNATLVAAGRMPDPRFGDNARRCYWVTGREWWYRLEFSAAALGDSPCTELCLDGVDGHADLYLNGEKLGRMENAFRSYRFDVRGKLRHDAPNVLLVRFVAIDAVMGGPRQDELAGWRDQRTSMRKPQFSFGWDWSLPLPSIGIAGGVWLEQHAGPRLLDVSMQTLINGRLDFKFQVSRAARDAGYSLRVRVHGHGADLEKVVERPGHVCSHTSLTVENPQLWWPNGMGAQQLYDWSVELVAGGEVADRRAGRLGIRECRILEEPFTEEAGPGISFWLMVNGQRVFCKGGNWIPLELWPATATDEQYRFYLQKTAEANFNMQRIWGGGIYERDVFYNLCDELGILVWQDFMFAGAGYPLERLRGEIIAESEYQVKRLRNHPSIALWCGCNEDVFSWSLPDEKAGAMADTGVYSETTGRAEINRLRDDPQIYSMILRGTVSKFGLGVPYIESSPQSYEDAGNYPESGNCHISCWKYALFETDKHPERFRGHFEAVCSFDSEFCIQGPCDVRSLKQFLPEAHHWPPDEMWVYHIQRGHANLPHYEQTLHIAGAIFGKIDNLQQYVKHGQATHVEMMRAEFESARRDRPNNGGTMMWMYNDCWPTSNWSIIDYYRRPKPSYYAAKRACAPLLPIVFERGGRVEFFFSNDSGAACAATLTYGQERLDGTRVWEGKAQVETGACDTKRFHTMERTALDLRNGDYLFIDAVVDGTPLPRVTYFPGMWKDVPWLAPKLDVEILAQEECAGEWLTRVRVTTDAYARFCHLLLPEEAGFSWLDDNFFDLTAGDSRVLTIHSVYRPELSQIQTGYWGTEWP